ncbi:LacI family DNA-binding transcriptional regulator [Streptomyces sp. NBC_01174]|uniref:LacI family DNA-binding transcriptional regulator n=1 Tax=Streptomyces sp. NBC_01174 TaxID=2903758 RepID=UPI002F915E84|nr:LacI family transcriptional regulator [Streptomyces sp. NBC_01174]
MATIQDVAKAAGVSAMTVSNVINDHPNVRRATREEVLEAMARLDYRVNLAARNLRKGRTGSIGLAVPGVNSAYYGELAAAIVAAAVRYDLRVSIEQTGALRENELAALSLSRNGCTTDSSSAPWAWARPMPSGSTSTTRWSSLVS